MIGSQAALESKKFKDELQKWDLKVSVEKMGFESESESESENGERQEQTRTPLYSLQRSDPSLQGHSDRP